MASSNVFVGPQPKNIQFNITEEKENQKMFKFKKLESEKCHFFFLSDTFNGWQLIEQFAGGYFTMTYLIWTWFRWISSDDVNQSSWNHFCLCLLPMRHGHLVWDNGWISGPAPLWVIHPWQAQAYLTITPVLHEPYSYCDSVTFHNYHASQSLWTHRDFTMIQIHIQSHFLSF